MQKMTWDGKFYKTEYFDDCLKAIEDLEKWTQKVGTIIDKKYPEIP